MILSLIIIGIWVGCTYSLVAFGLILTRRVCGFVNFAHGAIVLSSAYIAYACITWGHMNVITGSIVSLGCICLLAIMFEVCIFWPLRHRGATTFVIMLASLGLFVLVNNFIALLFGDQSLRFPVTSTNPIAVAGTILTLTQLGTLTAVAVFAILLAVILRSRIGIEMRAVADDVELAEISGINRRIIGILVTVIASLPAGLAGILWACDNNLNVFLGFRLLMFGLTAAIIGGSHWVISALCGGLIVGIMQYAGIWRIPTEWQDAIPFVLLVIFLLFKPEGFFGKKPEKAIV